MPLRLFISSVQKELELERAAVAALISTDPFLLQHCEPVLFEKEPPPARPAARGYLNTLRGCQLYVLILANEYGQPDGDLSATHHEYREAQTLKLPTVVFLKGAKDDVRCTAVNTLIKETKQAGYKYVRFHDREDLRPKILDVLRRALADEFKISATTEEKREGDRQVDAASTFESVVLTDTTVEALEEDLLNSFNHDTAANDVEQLWREPGQALVARGLAIRGQARDVFHPTVAAALLFSPHPAARFPQCEILADAYDDIRASAKPRGLISINAPLPRALEQALKFIDDHTFHPRRVVGLNNLRLDEYPAAALREALVNAVAHRSYDDRSRKVFVRVFSDRIEIASPGYPLKPLTLSKLRKGDYRPCSRNPLIAQTLAMLGLMEQRGSGFARMQEAMINHGLEPQKLGEEDGYFVVTLPGPAGNYDRLISPTSATGPVTPAIEAQLNERQKQILIEVQKNGRVTSGWCRKKFGVTYNTTFRDLSSLVALKLLIQQGQGRGTRYTLPPV